MSRLANALLTGAFASNSTSPMLDLRLGGQNGYSPQLTAWVSNQAYVQRNMTALVIEAPVGFQYMPDPGFWVGAFKALIELHPKSITGFARGLETEWVENAVGGGGEMQLLLDTGAIGLNCRQVQIKGQRDFAASQPLAQ